MREPAYRSALAGRAHRCVRQRKHTHKCASKVNWNTATWIESSVFFYLVLLIVSMVLLLNSNCDCSPINHDEIISKRTDNNNNNNNYNLDDTNNFKFLLESKHQNEHDKQQEEHNNQISLIPTRSNTRRVLIQAHPDLVLSEHNSWLQLYRGNGQEVPLNGIHNLVVGRLNRALIHNNDIKNVRKVDIVPSNGVRNARATALKSDIYQMDSSSSKVNPSSVNILSDDNQFGTIDETPQYIESIGPVINKQLNQFNISQQTSQNQALGPSEGLSDEYNFDLIDVDCSDVDPDILSLEYLQSLHPSDIKFQGSQTQLVHCVMKRERKIRLITTIITPIVFSTIILVGLVGNIAVILVIIEDRKTEREFSPPNLLILDLSLADLSFIVFCIPFTGWDYAVGHWVFGPYWCKVNQYLIVVCALSSIYTLVLMSLDRFMAVVYPIQCLRIRTSRNTLYAILVKWILILVMTSPAFEMHGMIGYQCRFLKDTYNAFQFQLIFFTSSYLFPLVLIFILYMGLLNKLWRGSKPVGHKESTKMVESKKKVTWLVAGIVIVFAICWCPIQVMLIMMRLGYHDITLTYIILQVFAHTLGYMNSCVNPIVYAFASENFNNSFKRSKLGKLFRNLTHCSGDIDTHELAGRGLNTHTSTNMMRNVHQNISNINDHTTSSSHHQSHQNQNQNQKQQLTNSQNKHPNQASDGLNLKRITESDCGTPETCLASSSIQSPCVSINQDAATTCNGSNNINIDIQSNLNSNSVYVNYTHHHVIEGSQAKQQQQQQQQQQQATNIDIDGIKLSKPKQTINSVPNCVDESKISGSRISQHIDASPKQQLVAQVSPFGPQTISHRCEPIKQQI